MVIERWVPDPPPGKCCTHLRRSNKKKRNIEVKKCTDVNGWSKIKKKKKRRRRKTCTF